MPQLSQATKTPPETAPDAAHAAPPRFVTAASLFDGHDAAINIVRRILLSLGAEVIHLGHNRSVEEVVTAALQEDARAIAISSYQGGHVEYLKYMMDMLRERGGGGIRVFAGGGGVIIPEEIRELQEYGVARVYSPDDGQEMGLVGMIEDAIKRSGADDAPPPKVSELKQGGQLALARVLSEIENIEQLGAARARELRGAFSPAKTSVKNAANNSGKKKTPVLGITGTGGAGKSSLCDELILRFRMDMREQLKIALIAVDPSRRKSGGALLGDRIRMNAISHPNIFMRSVATRGANNLPDCVPMMLGACEAAGYDLIILETPGIGQGDSGIADLSDCALYVMTPEYGAQSQLEKIDMLDFADFVAINKFDRAGAKDAYRDVCKQVQRNRGEFARGADEMPVYGVIASTFHDDGVSALYHALRGALGLPGGGALPEVAAKCSSGRGRLIPSRRARHLSETAECVRAYKARAREQAEIARRRMQLAASSEMLRETGAPDNPQLAELLANSEAQLGEDCAKLLEDWSATRARYAADELELGARQDGGGAARVELTRRTLSGSSVRKISLPKYHDDGDILEWLMLENLPGHFPFTAGVFPLKRAGEDPTRMFAGEGDAFRTNRRFIALSEHARAKRLSTAFDSVTLYGCDPDERPDIYGKVGNSGVSIATIDDIRELYRGFDLCDPQTSVSMTINGPAPVILAMFLGAAVDQKTEAFHEKHKREPNSEERRTLAAEALQNVRGTVQADILKEDQGQNTCIFSVEFSLKLMGDIQEYFIRHRVRNFYSVSISGYHIAEAGANPITQLAFTLANGLTYVESYLARGMRVDDFAPSLSFFFSNGMDPEYSVLGRVARRIWAVAMRERYGAGARAQKLKYHIQTSGRSLHAQEMDFNDIRTTLQALIAVYDNCNSLHTNAFDEAVTTPTEESVRRALAIQLIINNEWGPAFNHNPNQGSFLIEELTELVEEAVLREFESLCERGGVLGAMESGYQRGKIQDESMHYEQLKHDGSLPIIGVNTFRGAPARESGKMELARSSDAEKQSQIKRLRDFHARHKNESELALEKIKRAAIAGENIFAELMDAVRVCSLGQISDLLYQVGGRYRRNM